MATSIDMLAPRTVADLLALRRAHEAGSCDGPTTFARGVAVLQHGLGELSGRGLAADQVHAWAAAMAQLGDHLWQPLRQGPQDEDGPQAEAQAQRQAFWLQHALTPAVLGSAAAGEPFTAHIAPLRARAPDALQQAWALALALGCRGALGAHEAARLWAQLVRQPPTQQLPEALMGGPHRGAAAGPQRRALGRWWGVWAAAAGLALATAVVRLEERAALSHLAGLLR